MKQRLNVVDMGRYIPIIRRLGHAAAEGTRSFVNSTCRDAGSWLGCTVAIIVLADQETPSWRA